MYILRASLNNNNGNNSNPVDCEGVMSDALINVFL